MEGIIPTERREDFPVDTFRHLEQSIIQPLRRDAMWLAAMRAELRQPGTDVYRVECEDVMVGLLTALEMRALAYRRIVESLPQASGSGVALPEGPKQ
ncbi:MAG: hypothetical protein Q7S29_06045 [Candidatus Peribacter sp.]|nr:hypothetical protein [Candidatus Peribacter sp.]